VAQAGGLSRTVKTPLVIAILELLSASSPLSLTFEQVRTGIPGNAWPAEVAESDRRSHLRSVLLSLFACDGLELRSWEPEFATEVPAYPRVFRPALFVDNFKGTPGPYHLTYGFYPIICWLIPAMHGLVSRDKLVDLVLARIQDESLVFQDLPEGVVPGRALAQQVVDTSLEHLRRSAMFEVPPLSPSAPR
jgi:hypothetical protein